MAACAQIGRERRRERLRRISWGAAAGVSSGLLGAAALLALGDAPILLRLGEHTGLPIAAAFTVASVFGAVAAAFAVRALGQRLAAGIALLILAPFVYAASLIAPTALLGPWRGGGDILARVALEGAIVHLVSGGPLMIIGALMRRRIDAVVARMTLGALLFALIGAAGALTSAALGPSLAAMDSAFWRIALPLCLWQAAFLGLYAAFWPLPGAASR